MSVPRVNADWVRCSVLSLSRPDQLVAERLVRAASSRRMLGEALQSCFPVRAQLQTLVLSRGENRRYVCN